MIAAIAAWSGAAMATVMAARFCLAARQVRTLARTLEGRIQRAAEDQAFAQWASWTVLCVTDAEGKIHASTLRELHSAGECDALYDAPTAVALWHGDPDLIAQWEAELHGQEADRG